MGGWGGRKYKFGTFIQYIFFLGKAFIYTYNPETDFWSLSTRLTMPMVNEFNATFGLSVAINGKRAAVSARTEQRETSNLYIFFF